MRLGVRLLLAVAFTVMLPVVACGGGGTASHSSGDASSNSSTNADSSGSSASSASGSQSSPGSVQLDPAVAMPVGFPSDFPIYKGARLTQQGQWKANGVTSWAMTWETVEPVERVGKWYESQLNQGDWTVTFSGATTGNFSLTFTRKSNDHVGGIVGVDGEAGITRIRAVFAIG